MWPFTSSSPSDSSNSKSQPSTSITSIPSEYSNIDPTAPIDQSSSEPPRRPRRPRPEGFPETTTSKLWRELSNPSGGPVNELPGGTINSAEGRHAHRKGSAPITSVIGSEPKQAGFLDAIRHENPNAPWFFQTACARDSLLVGIGSGGAVGGLKFIVSGVKGLFWASQFAVGTFTLVAGGMYTWCQHRRKEEAKGMALAVQGMKMLHEKKRKEEEVLRLKTEEEKILKQEEEERQKKRRWF